MSSKRVLFTVVGVALIGIIGFMYATYIGSVARQQRQIVTTLVPEERAYFVNGKTILAQVAVGAPSGMPALAYGNGLLKYRKTDVKSLVASTNEPARTVIEGDVELDKKDVLIKVPTASNSDFNLIVHKVAEEEFPVSVANEQRNRTCLILKQPGAGNLKLSESKVGNGAYTWNPSEPRLTSKGMTMTQLAVALEGIFSIPVIDETLSDGRYNIDIGIPSTDPKLSFDELSEQLGIPITFEPRLITTTVVRPGLKSSSQ